MTPERVQADYHHTPVPTSARPDPRTVHGLVPTYARSFQTVAGSRRTSAATGPVGAHEPDQPAGSVASAPGQWPSGWVGAKGHSSKDVARPSGANVTTQRSRHLELG